MKPQGGFTLIELVVVIVILGILATTALPKFIDLSGDAKQAAVDGYAGALTSAFALNYAERVIDSARGTSISGNTAATLCTPILTRMSPPQLPTGYSLSLTGDCTAGAGSSAICTVTHDGKTAAAQAVCTGA